MTFEEFYGPALERLQAAGQQLTDCVARFPDDREGTDLHAVLYCKSRIKSPDSMIRKLELHGLPTDCDTALAEMHDTVGVRVICSFVDDVYRVAGWLSKQPELHLTTTKDYIAYPKPNGYRSLHLILEIADGPGKGLSAEIQLRTIATDFWANVEHQIKYKHPVSHEALVRAELKPFADDIASVDLSMQTIRELLAQSF